MTYSDLDGDAPVTAEVVIDGVARAMSFVSGSYTGGAVYRYAANLGTGTHTCFFLFEDGTDDTQLPSAGVDSAPVVSDGGGGGSTYTEDFEGSLGNEWAIYRSNATYGRNEISNYSAMSGSNSWRMDVTTNGNYSLNELVLKVSVSGATYLDLDFATREYGDELNSLPATFSGHYNGDGIAVSKDGTNWKALWQYPSSLSAWTNYSGIDVGAAAFFHQR